MQFRPCIDIHNGKVKQIVGSSLRDAGDFAKDNFVAEQNADYFARYYKERNITGGHVILLNKSGSDFFEETKRQALLALGAFPGGLQIGGGITQENAEEYLDAGASHVIVTSYVFEGGEIRYDRLQSLSAQIGKEQLVIDLSCRKRGEDYYIVTDRWQRFTDVKLTADTLDFFAEYCDEFLVHAVDVEGKAQGIEREIVRLLGAHSAIPATYAGGVHDYSDIDMIKQEGQDRVNVTIGSALDLFGGELSVEEVLRRV
ncbi:MAG: phosphoribosylformimino-5-aminoimidazole carboxamide ribotide isomerase [Lachnospiraceae bacterium]|nr:phosphoribosylformimino-5-aminoimidazole carboxamide ribotide isomerase [Lachnospiraceae bacterium]MDY4068285.1 phosphoribosylformimino-5-aminoimidazole carboxamide ribotide isomerase [Lachnospiraceae bacterium]